VAFYQESLYGFHVEVLTPTLCLILFYFLLQQRMVPSIVTALVVMSVKEDAPIAAAMVAIVASVETWISSPGKRACCRINCPALITLLLSVLAIPLLLAVCRSQVPTMYAPHWLDRLLIVPPGSLSGPGALFVFAGSNITRWLGSSVVRQWLWIIIVGSFGTILLRPYYLVPGVVTTLVAWLVNRNDFLWTPRLYPTEALLWCVSLVGFASIARAVTLDRKWARIAVLTAAVAIAALSATAQLALVPKAREAYLLRSGSRYSLVERHTPIWILGDSADDYVPFRISSEAISAKPEIHIEDYTLIDRRGRFVLLRKKD
jgi:uncharacterized membrane protein